MTNPEAYLPFAFGFAADFAAGAAALGAAFVAGFAAAGFFAAMVLPPSKIVVDNQSRPDSAAANKLCACISTAIPLGAEKT